MAKARFTKKAVEDLTHIYEYSLSLWGTSQADRYFDSIIAFCNLLAKNQNIGKNYDEISSQLLGAKALKHIIFYKTLTNNEIEVIRILGDVMDFKRHLK